MFQLLDRARKFLLEKMGNIIKKPEAKVVDVDIKDLSRDGATYIAKVSVSNPYITPIPIGEISYTLKSADRVVASGKMEDPGSLPGNEKTVLEVPVKVAHSILVSLVKDIGADWDIDYQLDLGLTVDLPLFGDITIPLSWEGEIKLPSLSSIF
ncbi:hypothetical protein VitviT2T_023861 [Vitis vinifera]|uniref:Desiccation protectant protein Lea14-like n=2 Tax=Vitis vinifera TaxID=29760 RepID=D7UCF2_VITVI|eukprot:XP_002277260.1 PREDICTED: desiccation protectant protein Lea14 homolog [Vitis vinifera]